MVREGDMLKELVLRIMAAVFACCAAEALLPECGVSKAARRALLILETAAIAAPIARLAGGML